MPRALAAALLLLGTAVPAYAKVLCPPGRFVIQTAEPSVLDGTELVLGAGRAVLTDTCAAVRAGQFHRGSGNWLLRVRARWRRCDGRRVALKARWDFNAAAYCTRLEGVVRSGRGPRTAFVADRIPECGNGLREGDELCDGSAGTLLGNDCCTAECTLKPDCPRLCDRNFPCGAEDICWEVCGAFGGCVARASVDCDAGPVCGCDGTTTYPSRCAAYDAWTGVSASRPCAVP